MTGSWHQVLLFESLGLWQSSCHKVWYLRRIMLPLNPSNYRWNTIKAECWRTVSSAPEPCWPDHWATQCLGRDCLFWFHLQGRGCGTAVGSAADCDHVTLLCLTAHIILIRGLKYSFFFFFWSCKSPPSFTSDDIPLNSKETLLLIFLSITLDFRKCCVPGRCAVNSSQSQRPWISSQESWAAIP